MISVIERRRVALATFVSIPISGASIDLYAPSLPIIGEHFGVSSALVQLTITIYLIGFGTSQLISGSLSDNFGRRGVALVGGAVFFGASIAAAVAPSITLLLLARLLQGIGVGFLSVPLRAAMLDVYAGNELHKVTNYITICWSLGPIIAPALGGRLQETSGWRANFVFLAMYGLVILYVLWRAPETLPKAANTQAFTLRRASANIALVLSNAAYIRALLSLGLLYLTAVLFNVVAPFYIQGTLGYTPQTFGFLALAMGALWLAGNVLNRVLLEINLRSKIIACCTGMTLTCLFMLYWATSDPLYAIACIGIQIFLSSILFPNFYLRAITLFPSSAGVASALMGAFMILVVSLGSAAGSLLRPDSLQGIAIAYTVIVLLLIGLQSSTLTLDNG
jgi:MFS transporter, DHA1 family, multidrug resistance protein